ncbi:MAG: transposase [Candidatus Nomurabacteria bacterium]|nr:transposase [Candidatus Nomurabacteria bacterium]
MLRKDPFITGEYYHLYNRGVDKRDIFKTERDFERFILLLYISNSSSEKTPRLDNLINHSHKSFDEIMILDKGEPLVSIGAWCLMTNHFHILVRQEVDGGITKFMRKLGVGYSMFFNIKYQRQGALFGGPFKSKCIKTDDNYMRQLFGYIHINPLDIEFSGWNNSENHKQELFLLQGNSQNEMKKFLDSYRYSSYLDYVGQGRIEGNILNKTAFPDYFQNQQSFKEFVENYFIKTL